MPRLWAFGVRFHGRTPVLIRKARDVCPYLPINQPPQMANAVKHGETLLLICRDESFERELASSLLKESWQLTTAQDLGGCSPPWQEGSTHQPAAVFVDFHSSGATLEITPGGGTASGLTAWEWYTLKRQLALPWNIRDHFGVSAQTPIFFVAILKHYAIEDVVDFLHMGFNAVLPRSFDQHSLAKVLKAGKERQDKALQVISFDSVLRGVLFSRPQSALGKALAEVVLAYCHDGKNALSTVGLTIQIMKEELDEGKSVQKTKSRLEGIERYIRDHYDVLSEIQHVADVFTRWNPEALRPTSMVSLEKLDTVVRHSLELSLAAKAVTLTFHADKGAAHLFLPTLLVGHFLGPLVANAVEAMGGAGEIEISVKTPPPPYDIEITLEDSGPGWGGRLEEIRHKVEQRSLDSVTPGRPSRGFGLKHVRRVLGEMGGGLVLEGNPGQGANVRVILPRQVFNEQA
jgi:hypothetical protein